MANEANHSFVWCKRLDSIPVIWGEKVDISIKEYKGNIQIIRVYIKALYKFAHKLMYMNIGIIYMYFLF